MGSMSASDAAPLPRLGEVFFDVRGESRSMRLSWYADTGVAVFSIWQGGTCTGTFRLPIADLPRMVEALQHGPRGREEGPLADEAARPAPQRRAPGRHSPPELPDSDIATGQTTVYLPAGAEVTGYHAEPPPGGPTRGYPDPGPGRSSGSHLPPPPAADYRAGQAREYEGSGSGDYPLPPLPPGYPDAGAGYAGGYGDPAAGGYHDEAAGRDYPVDHRGAALAPGEYGDGPPVAGRYDDEGPAVSGGYRDRGYRGRGSDGYPADPAPGGYPGYPEESAYQEDNPAYPGYPAEQEYHSYPPEQPYQDYPAEPGFGSPARPYVAGAETDDGEPFGSDRPEPRKPRGRRAAGPPPESFPYGPPPAGHEPRRRGHHPGRQ
jgi:hypothetical protein